MSPKERVRLSVYKRLLEEEKRKNSRKSYISISVFVIGIFAGSMYNLIPTDNIQNMGYGTIVASETGNKAIKSNMESIDHFFDTNHIGDEEKEIKIDEYFVMNMQA